MNSQTTSKTSRAIGWVLTGLAALFFTFDAVTHILKIQPVVDAFAALGYPLRFAVGLGVVQLIIVAVCLVPRTALLGVVLATGYLGGAMATNLRAETPAFNVVFPALVALFFWAGVWLRDAAVRSVLPLLRPAAS